MSLPLGPVFYFHVQFITLKVCPFFVLIFKCSFQFPCFSYSFYRSLKVCFDGEGASNHIHGVSPVICLSLMGILIITGCTHHVKLGDKINKHEQTKHVNKFNKPMLTYYPSALFV